MRDTSSLTSSVFTISSSIDSDNLLADLRQALQDLDIASARVRSLTEALAAQSSVSIQSLPLAVPISPTSPPRAESSPPEPIIRRPFLRGGRICRGDFVLINHPRPGQPSCGQARYSKNRFIYVYNEESGKEVFRHEANLTLLDS